MDPIYPCAPIRHMKSILKMLISRIILRFMRFYCLPAIISALKAWPDTEKWNGGAMEDR